MTKFLRRLRRNLGARWRSAGRSVRLAGFLLAALALTGAVWLMTSKGAGDFAEVPASLLAGRSVPEGESLLRASGIAARISGGNLLAPRESLGAVRRVLASPAAASGDPAAAFSELTQQDDIWRTESQNDKRWQAAKMTALGKLIASFPPIESAAVILEAGSPRSIGAPAQRPTAAVKVSLKEGARMSASLVSAIADLVAGSVSGMSSQDVRIVDAGGQSYHPADTASPVVQELERRRALEAYHADKAREALRYIDNVVVSVTVGPGEAGKMTAVVAVPRSYLEAAGKTLGAAAPAEANRLAAAEATRIQQTIARVLNINLSEVYVEAYTDSGYLRGGEGSAVTVPAATSKYLLTMAAVGTAAVALAAGAAWVVLRLRSRNRRHGDRDVATVSSTGPEQVVGAPQTGSDEAEGLAILETLTAGEILSTIRGEHPQTIAATLAHLAPDKAAAILAGLDDATRAEVSRRLARMERTEAVLVKEVAHQLAVRLRERASGRFDAIDGEHKMAEILRHADPETERAVLQALAGQSPGLVESVRKKMLAFEDILRLPSDRLGAALEGVSSEDLAVALRTVAEESKAEVLSALSSEAAEQLRAQMEQIGPVRLSEVEAAQQRVAQAVRDAEIGRYDSAADERRQLLA